MAASARYFVMERSTTDAGSAAMTVSASSEHIPALTDATNQTPSRSRHASHSRRTMTPLSEIAQQCGIAHFLIAFTDLFGTLRAKLVPARTAAIIQETPDRQSYR